MHAQIDEYMNLLYILSKFCSHNHQLFSSQQPQYCFLRKYTLRCLHVNYDRIHNVQLLNTVPEKLFRRNGVLRIGGALNRAFFANSFSFSCWIERSLRICVSVFLRLYFFNLSCLTKNKKQEKIEKTVQSLSLKPRSMDRTLRLQETPITIQN